MSVRANQESTFGKKQESLFDFTGIRTGKAAIRILPDNWTVITKDHSLSTQWEHTLLVTYIGVEVLTLRQEEK